MTSRNRKSGSALGLRRAALKDNETSLRTLLSRGIDINITDRYGRTALILAAIDHDTASIATLMKYGARPDIVDHFGNCAQIYLEPKETPEDMMPEAISIVATTMIENSGSRVRDRAL